jgi:hypothetical protein
MAGVERVNANDYLTNGMRLGAFFRSGTLKLTPQVDCTQRWCAPWLMPAWHQQGVDRSLAVWHREELRALLLPTGIFFNATVITSATYNEPSASLPTQSASVRCSWHKEKSNSMRL